MANIDKVIPRKIYGANSYPTIEIEVCLDNGITARASSPASLYDKKEHARTFSTNSFGKVVAPLNNGKDYDDRVNETIKSIKEEIVPGIVSKNANNQGGIDNILSDLNGTRNKFNSTVNSTLAISCAVAKAAAKSNNISLFKYIRELFSKEKIYRLPVPMINIFDGGVKTNNNLHFQALMIIPVMANSFKESITAGAKIFHTAKKVLGEFGLSSSVGDQGGYASIFYSGDEASIINWKSIVTVAIELIIKSISTAGYKAGTDVLLAIDADGDTSFFSEDGGYALTDKNEKQVRISRPDIANFYAELTKKYPIVLIEDCFAYEDGIAWFDLMESIGNKVQLAGDDIFFKQRHEREKMSRIGISNNVVVSLDRIITLSKVYDSAQFAKKYKYKSMIREGLESTEDPMMADLAVGCDIELIRGGGLCRTDRVAKYNQMLRIEEELGEDARFYAKYVFA